jgi:hypothetical protein
MRNRNMTLLLLAVTLWGCCAIPQQPNTAAIAPHDQLQDCLRKLWGNPVFCDSRAVAPVDPSVCSAPLGKIEDTLKAQHLSVFHLPNGEFLTSSDSFTPDRTGLYYRWKTPSINIRVIPLTLDESRQPSETELRQIADAILQRSHLAPLTCPFVVRVPESCRHLRQAQAQRRSSGSLYQIPAARPRLEVRSRREEKIRCSPTLALIT